MTELKPCPFCGGEAKMYSDFGYTSTYYGVVCTNCTAKFGGYMTFTTLKDAANAWNRRAYETN